MVEGRRVGTAFNVSHSGQHGLIAIARNGCLGIDVEERFPQRDFEGIGSLVFGPEERRLLGITAGPDRVHLFYRLWSMKEALIKALGTGFSLSPSRFEVPGAILQGDKTAVFRFPHLPSKAWLLVDLGEPRFAAALAYSLLPSFGSEHDFSQEQIACREEWLMSKVVLAAWRDGNQWRLMVASRRSGSTVGGCDVPPTGRGLLA